MRPPPPQHSAAAAHIKDEIVFLFSSSGLVKLQDLIRAPTARPMEVLLRQASPDTYKDVLKEVKAKEFYNLVIDTKADNMNFFLKGASRRDLFHPLRIFLRH